tara:strand:+ start:1414 stop:2085 length:672 start_codon:yes stop_codon:yes gene_type:complete
MVRSNPYPHIVWDSFLDKKTLKTITDEFPHKKSDFWTWKSNDTNSIKYMCQDQFLIEKLPNINNLIKYLNGSYFCNILSSIFEISNLVSDVNLAGGGLHMIGDGGFLKVHADFNQSDKKPDYHRRLNLILYLSDEWESGYNGNLELWNTNLTKAEVEIEPISNRMICFNTQPDGDVIAYHGHPIPLNVPKGIYRKSIALYYYTKEKPDNMLSDKHKTLYMDVQ